MPEKFTFVLMEKLLLISVSVCEHLRLVQFPSCFLPTYFYVYPSKRRFESAMANGNRCGCTFNSETNGKKIAIAWKFPSLAYGNSEHNVEQHNKA